MITPGPVVITVGFLVSGFAGAAVAALGVLLPCFVFTVLPAPYFKKISKNTSIKAFVDGITAAVMTDINPPLLETKQIVKATIAALILGSVLFAVAVLPTEYGIDPLGTGKLLGFSRLYQPDTLGVIATVETDGPKSYPPLKLEELGSGPNVSVPKEVNNPALGKQFELRQDSVTIRVPVGKGLEYKMNVLKYGQVKYEWATDKGVLFLISMENPSRQTLVRTSTLKVTRLLIPTI